MNALDVQTVTERVNLYACGVLSVSRYEHSVRVAALARDLCLRFSVDPDEGYLAGIAHDMCKSGAEQWLLSLATQDGNPIAALEKRKPSLLHGRAAAVYLAEAFGVFDRSILEAVRHHTFGAPDMDALGKIIFVADKIEPGRLEIDPEWRDQVLFSDLDGMAVKVLELNIGYLESRGKDVSSITREMFESLRGRV